MTHSGPGRNSRMSKRVYSRVSRNRARRIVLWTVAMVLTGVGPLMAYGPLLPWSPVHPGYQELRLERARVLYPADRALPEAYGHIDEWIADAEVFHSLRIHKRITVVLCRDWSDFHRFVPWLRGTAVAGVTLATGDAIYITPKVDEKRLDHGEFVRHELSHGVLSQNAGVLRAYSAPRRYPWLHEGLAVWFQRQRAFMTQPEFFEQAPRLGVSRALRDGHGGPDLRFGYVAWRDFLDHLDQTYGHQTFVKFVHDANLDPDHIFELFESAFRVSWDDEVERFERDVLTRRYIPRP